MRPRWQSTTVPYKGAVVEVSGIASHVGLNGMLTIEIENIIPNVPQSPAPSATADVCNDPGATKKGKFELCRLCFFIPYFNSKVMGHSSPVICLFDRISFYQTHIHGQHFKVDGC